MHHVTRHNTPIHNILSTAPELSKALGTLPVECNVMPKYIINKLNEKLLHMLVFHAYIKCAVQEENPQ
jgi:hypothetical protein